MHGHISLYLGQITSTINGLRNVIQNSTSFREKISFSWVKPDEKRRNAKNGLFESK